MCSGRALLMYQRCARSASVRSRPLSPAARTVTRDYSQATPPPSRSSLPLYPGSPR